MKKILILTVFTLLLLSCSSDNNNNEIVNNDEYEWLKDNLAGEWEVTDLWNSISGGLWVDSSMGFSDCSFNFKSDNKVIITDFNIDNGTCEYFLYIKNNSIYIKINGSERMVFSIDKKNKSITIYNYAKMKKMN